LTRRANHGHLDIIAKIAARAGKPAAGFSLPAMLANGSFNLSKLFRCIFDNLFTVKKSLTRRANQGHITIIAEMIGKPARSSRRGLFQSGIRPNWARMWTSVPR
jgi:hypothetical protein